MILLCTFIIFVVFILVTTTADLIFSWFTNRKYSNYKRYYVSDRYSKKTFTSFKSLLFYRLKLALIFAVIALIVMIPLSL